MKTHYFVYAALTLGLNSLTACSNEMDNTPPQPVMENQEYESKISDLEKKVGSLDNTTGYYSESYRLTQETQKRSHDYLDKLYRNINNTRAEHLPEWQQMYDTLTDETALTSEQFALGYPPKVTNFYRLNLKTTQHDATLDQHTDQLKTQNQAITANTEALRIQNERLGTIDRNIADLNALMVQKFAAVDKALGDYSDRITAIENRMESMETAFANLKSDLVPKISQLDARLKNVEKLLADNNLANFKRRIMKLEEENLEQFTQISNLETSLSQARTDITSMRDDLSNTQREFSDFQSGYNTWKLTVDDYMNR